MQMTVVIRETAVKRTSRNLTSGLSVEESYLLVIIILQ